MWRQSAKHSHSLRWEQKSAPWEFQTKLLHYFFLSNNKSNLHFTLSLLISSSVPKWPCTLVKEIKWTGSKMCERRSHGERGLSRLFRFVFYSWCESAQEFVCKQTCVNSSTRLYLFISKIQINKGIRAKFEHWCKSMGEFGSGRTRNCDCCT